MKRLGNFRWVGLLSISTILVVLFVSLFTIQPEVSAQATPSTMNITIQSFAFNPNTITIPVGTKVIWTNKDSVAHTVTSDSGGMLNSPLIQQNQTFEFTFTTAGTFSYHCSVHPNMKASIIVNAAGAAPAATSAASSPAATSAPSSPAKAPATGFGGGLNSSVSQDLLLWLIPLVTLSVITLLALAFRRRTHR